MRAKTEISSASLEARTTDAEIAALMDKTDARLQFAKQHESLACADMTVSRSPWTHLSRGCFPSSRELKSARRTFKLNRHAANAQIESDEVAAVKVRRMGDSPINARKTRMADLIVFVPSNTPLSDFQKLRTNKRERTGGGTGHLVVVHEQQVPYEITEDE